MSEPPTLEQAARDAGKQMSHDSLDKMRAVALAGAGFSAALMLFILQDQDLRRVSGHTLYLACTAMPLLLASGFMVENYMLYGESSYKAPTRPGAFMVMFLVFFAGAIALFASLTFLIRSFFPAMAVYFCAVSLVAGVLTAWHNMSTKPQD